MSLLQKKCICFEFGGNHIFQKLSNFHLEKICVLFLSSLSLGEKSVLCWSVLDVKGDRPYEIHGMSWFYKNGILMSWFMIILI